MTQKLVNVVIVVGSAVLLSGKPAFSIFDLFTTRSKYCNLPKNSVVVERYFYQTCNRNYTEPILVIRPILKY